MAQNFDEWMSHNEKRYAASSTISPTNDALSCVSKKKHDDYANVVMEMKSSQQFNFNNDEIDFDDGFGFSSSRQHPSPSDWESDHFQTNNFQQHSHIPRQQYHSEEFRGSLTRIRYVDPSSTQRSAGRPRHRSRGDVSQMKSSKPKRQGRTLYRERDNVNGTSSQRSKSTIKRNSERTMALAKLNTSNNDDISSDVWSSFEGAGGASWVAAGSRLASGHRHQMQQAQKAQQPQRQPPRRLDSYGSSYSTHTPPQVHHNDEGANSNSASSVAARRRRVKSVAESRQRQQQQQQQNQPSKSIALSPPPSSSAYSSASVSSSSGARRNMRMRMQNRSSPAPSKTANTSEGNSTPVPQQQLQSQLQSVSSSSFDRSTSMASMNSTEIDNEVNMAMNELKLSGVDIAIFKNTNTVQTSSSSSPKKGRTSPMTVGTKSLTLDSATIVSTRGNEVGKSLLTNTISVDQHSESSSLTNDTSDWQGQSGGNNMFKDANASTFHKSKRIVRPHEMKGGVSDQQLPLEEQSQPKSPSMKDRISQYKTASSASCSGPSSPPNKLAQISKNSRDVQTEQLEQSKPPLSPTGNRVKNSPFLKNEENNSNSSESAKSPVPSSSSKSKRHHHVSPTPFISQSEISQTGLTVARGSSKVSNESKTPTKDVATLMKERIATANSHRQIMKKESSPPLDRKENVSVQKEEVAKDPRAALMAMLNKRANPTTEDPPKASSDVMGDRSTPVLSGMLANRAQHDIQSKTESSSPAHGDRPSLKDDPKYAKYMKMLKVGMPLPVVQHAMTRDGLDPTILEGDHNEPVPEPPAVVPLNEDPAYTKYFKMLKLGLPLGAVKNAMERDGVNSSVMDGDHNAPASASKPGTASAKKKQKDTHRRTRLHWETLGQVNSNSVWAALADDEEMEQIEIDETEFTNLFQAEIKSTPTPAQSGSNGSSSRNAVQVIDPKRANNGGIILARLRMSYDDMAMVVDSVDETKMTANQVQGIIEYMPTPTERKSLRTYMKKSGGGGTEEKFDKLCECEKFMVAMISVKQSRMKLRALLFKLQFRGCIQDLAHDVFSVEKACDELSNSVKLRKLFGIVLNVGNRLNTAGPSDKRKASAFSIQSLLKLNQAKAFDNKTTFLQYVVLVVQRNNEKLLNFKDDLPTVAKADKIYWDQCINELEEMETQLEIVRKLALHDANSKKNIYSLPKKKSTQDDDESENLNIDEDMSLEEEVSLLRSTKLGMFALGAIKKVSQLRERVDIAKDKFARLLEYFGEDGDSSKMDVHELFAIINTFCGDFEAAREVVDREEQAKVRIGYIFVVCRFTRLFSKVACTI